MWRGEVTVKDWAKKKRVKDGQGNQNDGGKNGNYIWRGLNCLTRKRKLA